jgi:hypothetical protein
VKKTVSVVAVALAAVVGSTSAAHGAELSSGYALEVPAVKGSSGVTEGLDGFWDVFFGR